MVWLLAFGAALAWSMLDALRKRLSGAMEAIPSAALLSLGPVPVFAVWAVVEGGWFDSSAYVPAATVSVVLNALAYVSFMASVRASSLSTTVPLLALTPMFAAAVAAGHLGEVPTVVRAAGIVLVVVGALALHAREGLAGWLGLLADRGARFMLATAALWSLAAVADKQALEHAAIPAHALVQSAGVGLVLCAWLLARRDLPSLVPSRRAATTVLAAIAVTTAAVAMQLAAYASLQVGIVETAKRAVGVTMAVVIGRLVFGEPLTVRKGISVLVIVVGTVAASVG